MLAKPFREVGGHRRQRLGQLATVKGSEAGRTGQERKCRRDRSSCLLGAASRYIKSERPEQVSFQAQRRVFGGTVLSRTGVHDLGEVKRQ